MSKWYITTGVETMNGEIISGPFESRDKALAERTALETQTSRTYWIELLATR